MKDQKSEAFCSLIQFQKLIRTNFQQLERALLKCSGDNSEGHEEILIRHKENLRNLLKFCQHLVSYGDKSYSGMVKARRNVSKLQETIQDLQRQLERNKYELFQIRKQLLEKESAIHRFQSLSRIEANFISSYQFDVCSLAKTESIQIKDEEDNGTAGSEQSRTKAEEWPSPNPGDFCQMGEFCAIEEVEGFLSMIPTLSLSISQRDC